MPKQTEKDHVQISIEDYISTIQKQAEKGTEKYGQPMDPLDNYDWLDMASEELIDGHQYIVAEKRKRAFVCNKIRGLLNYKDNSVSKTEILHWLDVLEGK